MYILISDFIQVSNKDLLRLEKGQSEVIRKKNVLLFLFINFISNYFPSITPPFLQKEEANANFSSAFHGSKNYF